MGWSDATRVFVRGHDLPHELMGHIDLGAMAYLEITGRLPAPGEAIVFNAMLVSLVEHGIVPSVIATRQTYYGAPESLQGAVAAGLLGLGTTFVGTIEGSARMLWETIEQRAGDETLDDVKLAQQIVADFRARKAAIPGLGHPVHRPTDPRAQRLFELAREHGLSGRYVALMNEVQRQAELALRKPLPLNTTGAIGALACELGIPWQIARGLGVMSRAVGLVGHIAEEIRQPTAREIWLRLDEEASAEARASAT